MEVREIGIHELIPADYNPRKELMPGDSEYEKLKRSIQQFGYVLPVIVNKRNGVVVGGHQRIRVMKDLGHDKVTAIFLDLDDERERMLNIALNKIEGDWDQDKLKDLIESLYSEGYDVTLAGFDESEIDEFVFPFDVQEDAIPSLEEMEEGEEVECPRCKHRAGKAEFMIEGG